MTTKFKTETQRSTSQVSSELNPEHTKQGVMIFFHWQKCVTAWMRNKAAMFFDSLVLFLNWQKLTVRFQEELE